MERGQIVLPGTVRLGRVVIPSANTPVKGVSSVLVPKAIWKYKGPACTITLTYQVGYWGLTFNGMTVIVTELLEQPASATLVEFTSPAGLKGVNLTGLSGAADNRYDMEMWFKSPAFSDQGAIFTDCCQIAVTAQISVKLKNPPVGDYWQLYIANASKTTGMFAVKIPMGQAAIFDIPSTWDFPLSIILSVYQWVEVGVAAQEVYQVQTYWGPSDPNHAPAAFIPSLGNYFFNCATKQFEPV